MNVRTCRRAVALAFALFTCMARYFAARVRGPFSPELRAMWLSQACRDVLGALGVTVRVFGTPPRKGLVVSNHLSYLDIAAYAAVVPSAFVSKAEVGRWPYFGSAARAAGTIFLDRSSRACAAAAAAEIGSRLSGSVPVLLFPEGTSTDGSEVLRFHSRLLQPAVEAGAPITAAAIRYIPGPGKMERDVCWFGDAGFLPHVRNVLGVSGVTAEIHFAEPRIYADRRIAAHETHETVVALRRGAPVHV